MSTTALTTGSRLSVFTIIKRENSKPVWLSAGIATVNKDGSLNVMLFGNPANSELHIRHVQPKGEAKTEGGAFLPNTECNERLNVFNVREGKKEGDKHGNRFGTAWVNKDGSLRVTLDLLPLDGLLTIRKPKPEDEAKGAEGDDSIPF